VEDAKDLTDGFELIESFKPLAELLSVVSGEGNGTNRLFSEFTVKELNQLCSSLLHSTLVTFVREFVDNFFSVIDHHTIQAHRAGVNPNMIVNPGVTHLTFRHFVYPPLARMLHESLAATADMAVLPGVLDCRTLRCTVQVRLGSNPAVPRDG
jgi:hypothetical protein